MNKDSELTETLSAIDKSIAEYEAKVARGEALARMKETSDYKLVFEEGYIDAEANRLFEMLTAVPAIRRETMEVMKDKLEAIRHFKEYVGTDTYPGIVMSEANSAEDNINREKNYRLEVTATSSEEV